MGASWFTSNRISAKLVCRSPRLEKEGDPFSFLVANWYIYLSTCMWRKVIYLQILVDIFTEWKGESVNDEIVFFRWELGGPRCWNLFGEVSFGGPWWWKRGRHGRSVDLTWCLMLWIARVFVGSCRGDVPAERLASHVLRCSASGQSPSRSSNPRTGTGWAKGGGNRGFESEELHWLCFARWFDGLSPYWKAAGVFAQDQRHVVAETWHALDDSRQGI